MANQIVELLMTQPVYISKNNQLTTMIEAIGVRVSRVSLHEQKPVKKVYIIFGDTDQNRISH